MKISICTISFRHYLLSIDQIAYWGQTQGIHGIELWGVHAKNLSNDFHYGKEWLHGFGLETSMISDYLPLDFPSSKIIGETKELSSLAKHWGTKKIRTFAGNKGSHETSKEERRKLVESIKLICDLLESEGQFLLVETHPNTLTDNVLSTLTLLDEVNHPALKVNFDVLHIWESGVDPVKALKYLLPYISHFHFKNIASRKDLNVFAPNNVYAAAGSRVGMVPLFDGAVNYQEFIREVQDCKLDVGASLEWFGPNVKQVLENDFSMVKRMFQVVQ
ncbi:sugar phosphate isomerase/epimerase family protein [Bacillus spongiae]|uniref:Sugar phosphate isomerase/epimerase family protein n=1 Tax=Bacillus spongiae TaxID=2683610 RepID=A0ABU8H9S6_9BACI